MKDRARGAERTWADPRGRRPPAVAGEFYPSDPGLLSKTVTGLLGECSGPVREGAPVALISPHAGYRYSGRTAAEGYAALRDERFDAFVIVSPSHREYFDGISVYPGKAYSTPLGDLPVDDGLRSALAEGGGPVTISGAGHGREHAVEVQLPFIVELFGPVPFLPVVMGDQERPHCDHLGRHLARILSGRRALIVASTDLSHYHPDPVAREIDGRFLELLGRFDHAGLMDGLEAGTLEACGGGPAVAALNAAARLGARTVEIRHYATSGDAGSDPSSVVGYVSAIARAA